jgi:hypothetical protein
MDKQTYRTTRPAIDPIDGGIAPWMLLSLKFL